MFLQPRQRLFARQRVIYDYDYDYKTRSKRLTQKRCARITSNSCTKNQSYNVAASLQIISQRQNQYQQPNKFVIYYFSTDSGRYSKAVLLRKCINQIKFS